VAIARTCVLIACGFLLLGGLLLLIIPALDGAHSRQLRDEAAAASRVRTIVTLQDQYMAAHAYRGFVCELSLLKPIGQQNFPEYSLEFLTTGVQFGYRFSLANCGPDANRERVRYQVTAVPVEHGTEGFRAFCTDESGLIWYDADGSGTNCLASRRTLE